MYLLRRYSLHMINLGGKISLKLFLIPFRTYQTDRRMILGFPKAATILLAAYMDMDDVTFLRELRSRNTTSSGPTYTINNAALFHVNNMLANVFNVSLTDIPKPIDGAMALWDEYPFGSGWHVWMPGYNWNDVEKQMIKPSRTEHVYVASNGFTPVYGSSWSESALEVLELVIKKMDAS